MTQQQQSAPDDDPFAPGAGLRIQGFDAGQRTNAFIADAEAAFGPYFEGRLEPMAFPGINDRSSLTFTNDELEAVFWQFNGIHSRDEFRGLRAEQPPRRVSIAGVHLMGIEGDAVIRLFDEAGLMLQLGVLPNSRRLSRCFDRPPESID